VEHDICPIAESIMHVQTCLVSTSSLKTDITIVLPIFGIFMFAWIFSTFWLKRAVLGGQNRGMLTPNELVLTFLGLLLLCQFWWKSIKKCNRESADRQTHAVTEINWIYNLSQGQIIIVCKQYSLLLFLRARYDLVCVESIINKSKPTSQPSEKNLWYSS